jgi:hypothetical protein
VTDTARLNLDEHLSGTGFRHVSFDEFQRSASLCHLHCLHRPHRFPPCERNERESAAPGSQIPVTERIGKGRG